VVLSAIKQPAVQEDPFACFDEWASEADTKAMPRFERWDVIRGFVSYVERPIQQRRPALVVAAGLSGTLIFSGS